MKEVNYDEGNFTWTPQDNTKFDDGQRVNNYNNNTSKKMFTPPKDSRIIYVDGGSKDVSKDKTKKHYIGAWSFYDKETDEIHGKAEDNVTNNQMELLAAIRAIEYLDELGYDKEKWVTIRLDSDYVRFGIIYWVKKWAKNNWIRITPEGKQEEIKNLDFWKKLYDLVINRRIYWEHVKGHSGEEGNEKVDINCTTLIDEMASKIG
jgi:ribonuclease HI